MSFIGDKELVGKILCGVGLALAPMTTLFARHYSRTLYFIQFVFLTTSFMMMTTEDIVSKHLNWSALDFMDEFTSGFCDSGDFACRYGKLISTAIVWISVAAFMFILIKVISCKKRQAKFLSFYNMYKGFLYWFMPPLIFYAIYQIITRIDGQTTGHKDFMAGIIVVVAFSVLFIAELIAYKCAQREEENKARKWIEFLTHVMVSLTVAAVAIYAGVTDYQTAMKYIVPNVFIGIFLVIYLIGYKFKLKVFERILVIGMDGIIIATLNIIAFKPEYITDNHLDFWAIVVVAVIEILETIIKLCYFCKQGGIDDGQDEQVNPQKEGRVEKDRRVNNSFGPGISPENSFDGLRNSSGVRQDYGSRDNYNSPRRKPAPQGGRRR